MAEVLPQGITEELTSLFSQDPDVVLSLVEGLVERSEKAPADDYVFTVPEDVKEVYLKHRKKQKPH